MGGEIYVMYKSRGSKRHILAVIKRHILSYNVIEIPPFGCHIMTYIPFRGICHYMTKGIGQKL